MSARTGVAGAREVALSPRDATGPYTREIAMHERARCPGVGKGGRFTRAPLRETRQQAAGAVERERQALAG